MKRTHTHVGFIITISALCLLCLSTLASAQGRVFWEEGGVELCEATWEARSRTLAAVEDGKGGAIGVWGDERGERNSVWAQRVDRGGTTLWEDDGVLLKGNSSYPSDMLAVTDGAGGAIALWSETFTGPFALQVVAQHVDSAGIVRWGNSGVIVTGTDADRRFATRAMATQTRGVTAAWLQTYYGSVAGTDTLLVQRLDSLGSPQWDTGGVLVRACTIPVGPVLCRYAQDGVVVGWVESPGPDEWQLRLQRITPAGLQLWGDRGILATASGSFLYCEGVVPVVGGVVAGWSRGWAGEEGLWAQMVDSSGRATWDSCGRCVYPGSGRMIWDAHLCSTSDNGTLWVWSERRGDEYEIICQALDSSGSRMWDSLGVRLGTVGAAEGRGFSAVPDGSEGLVVTWPAQRDEDWDIVGQHVDGGGALRWGGEGLVVAGTPYIQFVEPVAVTDQEHGAVVLWGETRPPLENGVRAQRVGDASGVCPPRGSKLEDRPQMMVSPSLTATGLWFRVRPGSCKVEACITDALGRRVRRLKGGVTRDGWTMHYWNGCDDAGVRVASGVYYCVGGEDSHRPAKVVVGRD